MCLLLIEELKLGYTVSSHGIDRFILGHPTSPRPPASTIAQSKLQNLNENGAILSLATQHSLHTSFLLLFQVRLQISLQIRVFELIFELVL